MDRRSPLLEGLEDALVGQEEGATPTVAIPPEKGYGEWSEDNVQEYEREEFVEMVGGELPEEGAYLETEDGGLAEIVGVDDSVVRVDFNHSLAGETLEFDIEIVDVSDRAATARSRRQVGSRSGAGAPGYSSILKSGSHITPDEVGATSNPQAALTRYGNANDARMRG